ncbi:hypothetical protein BDV95DRAFT_278873 [Massariosphaeria phaeospora]|uniref:Retinol dehydrogenase 12 n=1 Tax=Massariosphaeria phaeospora TaxID=100035 RepID=A0A7C8IJ59_9PLEO|nr:hypothetical protein BDV95DRAFT_278873 [Massariosphaeria phaeospora]
MATPMSALTFTYHLLYSQLFLRPAYPTASFAGQTVIVTGSNTGLGFEAARHIVLLGASKVILAVRTVSKGEAAAAKILESTKATKTKVEVWPLDLSNYDSIKAFAERAGKLDRLDAVLQNAGILSNQFKMLEEDEAHITVNVVGAVLLGLLVLPKLRQSAKDFGTTGRLSFVGSDSMHIAPLKEAKVPGPLFDALREKEGVDMGSRYPVSKLLLFYAVREIAARSPATPESNVVINVMTPGLCKSDIFREDMPWLLSKILSLLSRTTEQGGIAMVDAVRPDLETSAHGAFLWDCRVAT